MKEEELYIDGSLHLSANPFLLFNLHFMSPPKVEVSSIGHPSETSQANTMSGSKTVFENLLSSVCVLLGLVALSLSCGHCFGRACSGTGAWVLLKRNKRRGGRS